jgi:Putative zinc-finger
VNCLACRQHLEPYLDDELSVKDNVAVLDHVTGCSPCQDVFNAEKRIRETLRARLLRETCPPQVVERLLATVRSEARGSGIRKALLWGPPVAAAIALAFLIPGFLERRGPIDGPSPAAAVAPARKIFAAERTHDHAVHGEFLAWAGARYDELTYDLPHGKVLNAETLKLVEPRSRAVASLEELEKVVKAETKTNFKLPAAFTQGGRVVGGELLRWDEGWVPQIILEFGDREVVLYDLSQCHARHFGCQLPKLFASFHRVESDEVKQVSIAACRGCDAVLVLKQNRAWLLLSRHGRDWDDDWMLDRARKLLD